LLKKQTLGKKIFTVPLTLTTHDPFIVVKRQVSSIAAYIHDEK
jgi:hypothetical protein